MAYQNVGTPRFFIDNYMYLRALGLDPQAYIDETDDINDPFVNHLGNENQWLKTPLNDETIFTLSPEISKPFVRDGGAGMRIFIPCGDMVGGMDFSGNMKWYGAILNHNLGDCDVRIQNLMFMGGVNQNADYNIGDGHEIGVINSGTGIYPDTMQNGSSIFYSNLSPSDMLTAEGEDFLVRFTGFALTDDAEGEVGDTSNLQVGAISMGVMYTMPSSADLQLTMEIEFDGYDEVKTIGGSTLTNITQTGAPVWSNDGKYNSPFSVGDFSDSRYLGGAKRNGRRSWSLKFSYIADSDIFASNYMNTNHLENDASNYDDADKNATGDAFEYNMFTDDSFMAQVWNKTLGGALPFIFQPDSNNDNPDQFCIAKFDMDTLNIKQVAFKTYNIAVKIREVW